jgi:hypothetical protein
MEFDGVTLRVYSSQMLQFFVLFVLNTNLS